MPEIRINRRKYTFEKGETILNVAWRNEIYIPALCYHPHLPPFAGCRICLVEVKYNGKRALLPSCTTEAQEGMEISTDSAAVQEEVRKSVLEFMLRNHPIECPICDCGGECDFQNLVYLLGPEIPRYNFPKEEKIKIKALPFLELYPNRCILCSRCVNFYREVSGDTDWGLYERGPFSYVGPVRDKVLESEFSGNMIEICPLGAISGVDYRFKGRPWENDKIPAISPHDSLGSSIYVHVRKGGRWGRGPIREGGVRGEGYHILRITTRPQIGVNHPWIDDRTRFIHGFINSRDRVLSPLIRKGEKLEETSWEKALNNVEKLVNKTIENHGPESIALISGGVGTNESAFLMAKLMRNIIGSPHLDSRSPFSSKDPMLEVLGVSAGNGKIEDIKKSDLVFVFHNSIRGSAPLLAIPLFERRKKDIPIYLFSPHSNYGERRWVKEHILLIPPHDEYLLLGLLKLIAGKTGHTLEGIDEIEWEKIAVEKSLLERLSASFINSKNPLMILSENMGYRKGKIIASFVLFKEDAKILLVRENPNGQGFIDMGIHPDLTSGHRLSPTSGMNSLDILRGAEEGKIKGLFLWNVDPILEFPGGDSVISSLKNLDFLIVIDSFLTESSKFADIVLPVALPYEEEGSYTNTEGRVQFSSKTLNPPPLVLLSYKMIGDIIKKLSGEEFPEEPSEIFEIIKREVPLYRDIKYGEEEIIEESYPPFIPSLEHLRRVTSYPVLNYSINLKKVKFDVPPNRRRGFILIGAKHLYKNRYGIRTEIVKDLIPLSVEMSEDDAEKLGISDGDEVMLISSEKKVRTKVKVTLDVPPGVIKAWGPLYYPLNNLLGEEGFGYVKIEVVK